jgi:hypothetical protein
MDSKRLYSNPSSRWRRLPEASSDLIKDNFEPVLVSARNFLEDRLSPIPGSALIGINLTFYLPSADAGEASAEEISATIPGSLCLASNGHSIVRPFDESANGHKTNVIMHIACRPSGRIYISLYLRMAKALVYTRVGLTTVTR